MRLDITWRNHSSHVYMREEKVSQNHDASKIGRNASEGESRGISYQRNSIESLVSLQGSLRLIDSLGMLCEFLKNSLRQREY